MRYRGTLRRAFFLFQTANLKFQILGEIANLNQNLKNKLYLICFNFFHKLGLMD